jgi:hypothetical protein
MTISKSSRSCQASVPVRVRARPVGEEQVDLLAPVQHVERRGDVVAIDEKCRAVLAAVDVDPSNRAFEPVERHRLFWARGKNERPVS